MDVNQLRAYFHQLDRAFFIDNENKSLAYLNNPLPIGYGQTISQPTLVLQMTELLSPEPDSHVLEIGTGSGYQTAFLAKFAKAVVTIERIRALSVRAEERLVELGFANIEFLVGDGSTGCPERGPYDRIMVTAAAGRVPDELIDQLKPGGRLIIPVGSRFSQELLMITRDDEGKIHSNSIERVIFVELKGRYGWSDQE